MCGGLAVRCVLCNSERVRALPVYLCPSCLPVRVGSAAPMLSQYGEVSARYGLVLRLRPDDAYVVIAHISDVCFSFAACMSRRYRIVVVPCGSCASDTFQVTADLLHATSTSSRYMNDTRCICWSTTASVLEYGRLPCAGLL